MMYKHREKQYNDFMAFVRKIRERLQVSQAELAKAVGVTTPRISDWERGISTPSERYLPVIYSKLSYLLAEKRSKKTNIGTYLNVTIGDVVGITFMGATHLFYDKLEVVSLIGQLREKADFLEENLDLLKGEKTIKTKPGKSK